MAKEGKAPKKKREAPPKRKAYKIEGAKVSRAKKTCPRCGAGTFLAEHKNRFYCGRCHYTIFKEKSALTAAPKPAAAATAAVARPTAAKPASAQPAAKPAAQPATKPAAQPAVKPAVKPAAQQQPAKK